MLHDLTMPVESSQKTGILSWLKQLYHGSRGFEVGTFQASILGNSMAIHSMNWNPLAYGYISDIITSVDYVIKEFLAHVCPDTRVRERLQLALYDGLCERFSKGIEQVTFLLDVERKELPSTIADSFARELDDR